MVTTPRNELVKVESLDAPVDYARLDSSSALINDDEESKEDSADRSSKGPSYLAGTVNLRDVVDVDAFEGPRRKKCFESRRSKSILLFCLTVISIGGVVAAIVVLFGSKGDVEKNSLANGSEGLASLTANTTTAAPVPTPAPTPVDAAVGTPPTTRPIAPPSTAPPATSRANTPSPSTTRAVPQSTTPATTSSTTQSPPVNSNLGRIRDGTSGTLATEETNPATFPDRGCKLPNYRSHDGQLFAQNTATGVESPVGIKGINWFGMDTVENLPFGLWANDQNGTTIYEIVAFLARHKFNSVRLPLNVRGILANAPTNANLVNTYWSPSIDLTSYLGTVGSVVRALGSRGISVLLDLHYLSPTDKGDAWFSATTPESDSLAAIDALAAKLCNDKHWNILGLDLKNEPWDTTWGDHGPRDFRVGAATLGNRMLQKCPQWLAFVEGNAKSHKIDIKGQTFDYYDWWGGGLQKSGEFRLALDIPAKIVWAPHYYSPSVYPQTYLVKDATRGKDVLTGYSEWTDDELSDIVRATSEDMFGYLRHVQDGAIVFGEFGGLYALDAHPRKTSQRVIQDCMKVMKEPGYAGGYMWSLNPESGYAFNPSSTAGYWEEGLLKSDWVTANMEYLNALQILDDLPNLHSFPCFA